MRVPGGTVGSALRCFSKHHRGRRIAPTVPVRKPYLFDDSRCIHRPEIGLSGIAPPYLRSAGGLSVDRARDSCILYDPRQQQRRGFLGFGDGDEDTGLSKHYEEKRLMGYSPEQLFDVVAGIDFYQDFVPWCQKSNVIWQKDSELEAELVIGFQFFVESYVSHVHLERPKLVKTSVSQSAIFEYLNNVWEMSPGPSPGSCNLHFLVDFQFRSPLYSKVANMFFDEVVARLVGAFENRCLMVYGPSKVETTYAA